MIPSTGKRFFSFLTHPGWLWARVKQPGCEAGHWIPCSSKTKSAWSQKFTTPYAFMVWCFIKYRDHIACLLYLYLKETGWKNLMCPLLGFCEYGNEPLNFIVVGHFFTIWLTVRLWRWSYVELVKINIYVCLHFIFLKFIMLFCQKKKKLFILRNCI